MIVGKTNLKEKTKSRPKEISYTLCIQERNYRPGFYRTEKFDKLSDLEQTRTSMVQEGRKMWVE